MSFLCRPIPSFLSWSRIRLGGGGLKAIKFRLSFHSRLPKLLSSYSLILIDIDSEVRAYPVWIEQDNIERAGRLVKGLNPRVERRHQ